MSEMHSPIEKETFEATQKTLSLLDEYKNSGKGKLRILESEDDLVRLRKRITFSRSDQKAPYPDLLDIQLKSFEDFLQEDVPPAKRRNIGLQSAFLAAFPIEDASGTHQLEFVEYSTEKPKLTEEQCSERELTYSKPLKVKLRLSSKADKSSDEYAEAVPQIAELLGNKAVLVVAGDPECREALTAKGITNFINVKCNVLETLKDYQQLLGIKEL